MGAELTLANLSNDALREEVDRVARNARHTTVQLIAVLAEVAARRLWAEEGCGSFYAYCTEVLHFSEQEAYLRMEAARVVNDYPGVLARLASGELSLTTLGLLKPHLTQENHVRLLDAAVGKTRREVARQVAALKGGSGNDPLPAVIRPVAADRFQITFEMRGSTYDKLQRAKDLLAHAVADGNIATIVDRALTSLLRELERSKYGATDRPRPPREGTAGSRYIPAWVRRAVFERDGGRCAFHGPRGRCPETSRLEFHHVVPFAEGGESTIENIQLRCRAHNQREAEIYFGAGTSLARERGVPYGELGPDPVGLRLADGVRACYDRRLGRTARGAPSAPSPHRPEA